MTTVIVKQNQSLFDISIQEFGTVEACVELAFENDLSITDELTEGDELVLPVFENANSDIVTFFNKYQIKPVSALSDADFAIVEIENCNLSNCFK